MLKSKTSQGLKLFLLIAFAVLFNLSQNTYAQTESDAEMPNNCGSRDETFAWNYEAVAGLLAEKKICVETVHSNNAFNYRFLGKLSRILGKLDEAEDFLEKGLKIAVESDDLAETSKIYSELSLVFLENGAMKDAENALTIAVKSAEKANDKSAQAFASLCYGDYLYIKKDRPKTVEAYRKAAELSRETGNKEIEGTANMGLGYHFLNDFDFENSLVPLNSALEIFQQTSNQRGIVFAYKSLGTFHNLNQDKQKAIEFYQKAENLFPEKIDFIEKGSLYNSIGSIYENYGDWKLSKIYREKALNIFKENNHPFGQLTTLTSLGAINRLNGKTDEAIQNLQDASQTADNLNDEFYRAVILEELGNIYLETGYSKNALNHFNKSLNYFSKQKINGEIAQIHYKIGRISENEKNFQSAREQYSKSMEFAEKVKNTFLKAELLHSLARIETLDNNKEKALELIKDSIELTENLSSNVYNSKLQQSYFSNSFERYEIYIGLLMSLFEQTKDQKFSLEALRASEKSRARSMLEKILTAEAKITKDALPEAVEKERSFRNLLNIKSDRLTDLLNNNSPQTEITEIENEIKTLENELEILQAEFKQKSPQYFEIKNPSFFDQRKFQENVLDENSFLLEFSFGETASFLWLIDKSEVKTYVLPPRREIETHIEKLLEIFVSREIKQGESIEDYQQRVIAEENLYIIESKKLSSKLFGQIGKEITNKRLIIVPDGKLHYFPVSALPLPNSETNEPFLLSNEIVYAPSAQTLLLLQTNRTYFLKPFKSLLIFSDPIFTDDDPRFSDSKNARSETNSKSTSKESFRFVESLDNLSRLTGSKNESDSILNIIGSTNVDSFTGFEANRTQLLKTKTEDYKIIHFATHGITHEKRPELSGIVLSRFDESGKQREEFFRIHDIYGLNLNADLVVLSACETGLGKEVKGEGLMSLNNAFLQTGAKTVMSSLWKVEDTATLELMKNFYGAMAEEKLTPSQALRQAQIKLRQNSQFRSPFYWAAFTVQGDFRNVPQISPSFNKFYYFFALIPFILIGAIFLYRKKFYSKN